jgi:hypothetical protein
MKYHCEACNYFTEFSGNFSTHKRTKKHSEMITKKVDAPAKTIAEVIPELSQVIPSYPYRDNYRCPFCENIFSQKSNLSRHKKLCKNQPSDNVQKELLETKLKLELLKKKKNYLRNLKLKSLNC